MGRVCAAVNCTSRQKKDSGISFHEFPHKRPEVLTKWLQNVRREKWFPREKSSFLCSQHFLPDCFEGGRQALRRLRDDAIPTVFDYTVKSRKRKLSAMARVKRLAKSTSSVITSSVERNHRPQKSTSKVKPHQTIKKSAIVRFPDDTTNKGNWRCRRDIENRLRRSRLLCRKIYTSRHVGHDRVEKDEGKVSNTDKKNRLLMGENPREQSILRTANNKMTRFNSEIHNTVAGSNAAASDFQTVTIVPTVTNGNGEVSYRLIVQDCVDNTASSVDSGERFRTRNEPGSSEMSEKFAAQSLLSSRDNCGSRLMKCSFCKYVTRKRYLLSRHLKAHLEHHAHQCDQCPFSFKTLLALQNHVNTHRGVRPFRCRRCDDQFTTSGEFVTHMQSCHETSVELSLWSELQGCNSSISYLCPFCSFISSDAGSLRQHLVVHSVDKQ